mmetsp:Transcript_25297/g.84793  ORF Transcript_25297/g.84793 Transcript_25297/m.84793 type:complete len:571 (+) Transcript_25297:30-1742(+)
MAEGAPAVEVDNEKENVQRPLNCNVGVLGHVDSGKTSLARALSTMGSTASFDKHPQSKERGITLDLGFSAFLADVPEHIARQSPEYSHLQFTLVDCPGHASLIRTVIGGAQIIDMMILVIDLTKGIQTQTAECLVIGELTAEHMIVVLNKLDLLPEAGREEKLERMKKGIRKALGQTKFKDAPMVALAARPFAEGAAEADLGSQPPLPPMGLEALVAEMRAAVRLPERHGEGPLHFAIDHCFPIKGQGTVCTGTILRGSLAVNETIEFPELRVDRKVKSIQMFKRPVQRATQGDRVGVCVTQLNAEQLERGIACSPGSMLTWTCAVIAVRPIRFYKGISRTGAKFHLTVGHTTVMAKATFFGLPKDQPDPQAEDAEAPAAKAPTAAVSMAQDLTDAFDAGADYAYQDELRRDAGLRQWAVLELEHPVTSIVGALLIASHLEADVNANSCRLAFYGRMLQTADASDPQAMAKLRVFKRKCKTGQVDRVQDANTVIGRNLFNATTDVNLFVGMKVNLGDLEGTIASSFGKAKFKVDFRHDLDLKAFQDAIRGKQIELRYRRYIFDTAKRMVQ